MNQGAAKLAAAPFALRLSLTFAPAFQRERQTALHAIYLELREIPQECRDPGVADVKLRWWEEEFDCLYAGKARHPLTQALRPHLELLQGRRTLFSDLIAGTRHDIAGAGFPTFEDVKRYCFRHSGALAELSALLGGAQHADTLLAARLLGNASCLADIAATGVAAGLRGRLYFAAEDLKLHGVDRHISTDTHEQVSVRNLVKDYVDRAQALRADALRTAPLGERQALTVWQVRSRLALMRAHKQERTGSRHAEEPVELHPLSALWIAWRAARHAS